MLFLFNKCWLFLSKLWLFEIWVFNVNNWDCIFCKFVLIFFCCLIRFVNESVLKLFFEIVFVFFLFFVVCFCICVRFCGKVCSCFFNVVIFVFCFKVCLLKCLVNFRFWVWVFVFVDFNVFDFNVLSCCFIFFFVLFWEIFV